MARKRRGASVLRNLNDRSMRAYLCGRRLYAEGNDVVASLALAKLDLGSYLRPEERAAYESLLPATWWVMWWRGWNEAAARDAAEGTP